MIFFGLGSPILIVWTQDQRLTQPYRRNPTRDTRTIDPNVYICMRGACQPSSLATQHEWQCLPRAPQPVAVSGRPFIALAASVRTDI